jgi:hypothetical protein
MVCLKVVEKERTLTGVRNMAIDFFMLDLFKAFALFKVRLTGCADGLLEESLIGSNLPNFNFLPVSHQGWLQ